MDNAVLVPSGGCISLLNEMIATNPLQNTLYNKYSRRTGQVCGTRLPGRSTLTTVAQLAAGFFTA